MGIELVIKCFLNDERSFASLETGLDGWSKSLTMDAPTIRSRQLVLMKWFMDTAVVPVFPKAAAACLPRARSSHRMNHLWRHELLCTNNTTYRKLFASDVMTHWFFLSTRRSLTHSIKTFVVAIPIMSIPNSMKSSQTIDDVQHSCQCLIVDAAIAANSTLGFLNYLWLWVLSCYWTKS